MTKISEENFLLAYNNPRLIKGALKRAHVFPHADIYDDLYMEGLIIYAASLEKWREKKTLAEIDRYSYFRIYWMVLDQLRCQQRRSERFVPEDDYYDSEESEDKLDWDTWIILKDKMKDLTQIEKVILVEHLLDFKTLTQIGKEYQVPMRTLYRNKKQLIGKLRRLLSKQNM